MPTAKEVQTLSPQFNFSDSTTADRANQCTPWHRLFRYDVQVLAEPEETDFNPFFAAFPDMLFEYMQLNNGSIMKAVPATCLEHGGTDGSGRYRRLFAHGFNCNTHHTLSNHGCHVILWYQVTTERQSHSFHFMKWKRCRFHALRQLRRSYCYSLFFSFIVDWNP